MKFYIAKTQTGPDKFSNLWLRAKDFNSAINQASVKGMVVAVTEVGSGDGLNWKETK